MRDPGGNLIGMIELNATAEPGASRDRVMGEDAILGESERPTRPLDSPRTPVPNRSVVSILLPEA